MAVCQGPQNVPAPWTAGVVPKTGAQEHGAVTQMPSAAVPRTCKEGRDRYPNTCHYDGEVADLC